MFATYLLQTFFGKQFAYLANYSSLLKFKIVYEFIL